MTDKKNLIDASGLHQAITIGNGVTTESAIGELVDNAYDANASFIKIVIKEDGLYISDNGEGITPEELPKLNTLFYSDKKDKEGKIGNWGIGYHAAVCTLGKRHYFVSNGKYTMTKRNQLKEYDEDRDKASDLPSSASNILGEAFNTDNTFVVIEDNDCHINIDALKKYLSHTYMTYISDGNKIVLNGEVLVSEPFTYPKEEQSVDIEFTIKSKNIPGREGTYYLIKSNNEDVVPTTILNVKKPLTEQISQTQAIKSPKQGFYEVYKSTSKGKKKEDYDQLFKEFNTKSNGKINDCPTIKTVCRKETAATTGGICITLGTKTLPKREHATPFNLGKYQHVYTGMKTTITGVPNMFHTYTNKNILAGPLNQRFKDKMFYAVHYWLYLTIARKEENRLKEEKKDANPNPPPPEPSQPSPEKVITKCHERNPPSVEASAVFKMFSEDFNKYYRREHIVLEGQFTTFYNFAKEYHIKCLALEREQEENVKMTINPKKNRKLIIKN